MANLDFYGLQSDLRKVLSFIYNETDAVVFESYSEYDRELRRFTSLTELQTAFEIGISPKSQVLLQLWSQSVIPEPIPQRIELNVKGFSFRYSIEAVGLIQLYLGGLRNNVIVESHYGHWSKAGAERRSALPTTDCNWESLKKLSGRLQRFISGMASAKFDGRVILPEAYEAVQKGSRLRFLNTEFDAASAKIVPIAEESR
jgi:hypothetical protein